MTRADASPDRFPTIVLAGRVHWYRFVVVLFVACLAFGYGSFALMVAGFSPAAWGRTQWTVMPPLLLVLLGGGGWYAWWILTYGAWLTPSGFVLRNGRTTYRYAYEELAEIEYDVGRSSVREHLILKTHPEFGFRRTNFLHLYFRNRDDLVKGLIQNALGRGRRVAVDPYLLEHYGQPPYEIASDASLAGMPRAVDAPGPDPVAGGFPVVYRKKAAIAVMGAVMMGVVCGGSVFLGAAAVALLLDPATRFRASTLPVMSLGFPMTLAVPFVVASTVDFLGTRVVLSEDGVWVRLFFGRPRLVRWREVQGVYRQTTWWEISTSGPPDIWNPFAVFSRRNIRVNSFLLANEGEFVSALVTNVMRANPGAVLHPDLATVYGPLSLAGDGPDTRGVEA